MKPLDFLFLWIHRESLRKTKFDSSIQPAPPVNDFTQMACIARQSHSMNVRVGRCGLTFVSVTETRGSMHSIGLAIVKQQ